MAPPTYTGINLDTVLEVLTTATREAERLTQIELPVDEDSVHVRRTEAAEVSRDLLYLSDALQAASVLVKSEYWAVKGKALVP